MARKRAPKAKPLAPRRPLRWALLASALVLAATADDRHVGKFSDGRQLVRTAVAITETFELGQGRGAARAVARPGGDVVMRYGMGMSLAQLPAALLAPLAERSGGRGASQSLFLLAPFAFVLVAAAAAGRAARLLGASDRGEALAVVLTALGSPLGAYAALETSESLQAAALAVAFAAALAASRPVLDEATRRSAARAALLCGAAAGTAVLAKSVLLAVAPLAALPLLRRSAPSALPLGRRAALGALGAAAPLALWLAFEVVRFGRPLSSYGGERFSHPLLDGLWRLLAGPNEGLLLFFPALAVAAVAIGAALLRGGSEDGGETRLAAAASLGAFLALLALSASWWAWHGVGGWGPRLLVPAVPLLSPWAGLLAGRWRPAASTLLAGLSVALNLPPLLVHPSLVDTYVANLGCVPATPLSASGVPEAYLSRDAAGAPCVTADQVLSTVPAAAPHLVYPWFLSVQSERESAVAAERLSRPPWRTARPDIRPRLFPVPQELAEALAPPRRLGFLGRSLLGGGSDPTVLPAYLDALTDQVLRAQATGRAERALGLAEKLSRLSPGGEARALVAESLRLLARPEGALAELASLSPEEQGEPSILLVHALLARDRGDGASASRALAAAAAYLPGTPAASAVDRPVGEWPATLAAMLQAPVEEVTPALPGVGAGR